MARAGEQACDDTVAQLALPQWGRRSVAAAEAGNNRRIPSCRGVPPAFTFARKVRPWQCCTRRCSHSLRIFDIAVLSDLGLHACGVLSEILMIFNATK